MNSNLLRRLSFDPSARRLGLQLARQSMSTAAATTMTTMTTMTTPLSLSSITRPTNRVWLRVVSNIVPKREFAAFLSPRKLDTVREVNFVPTFYTTQRNPKTISNSSFNVLDINGDIGFQIPPTEEKIDYESIEFLLRNGIKVPLTKLNVLLKNLTTEMETLSKRTEKKKSTSEMSHIFRVGTQMKTLFERMLDCSIQPDMQTYYYLSRNFSKYPEFFEAHEAVISEMLKTKELASQSSYNILNILNNRIRAATRVGDLPTAIETLRLMREIKVYPNAMTYNNLLFFISQSGDVDSVLLLYNVMKEDRIKPDIRTYAIAVQALAKAGLHEEALALFYEMQTQPEIPEYIAISLLITLDKGNAPIDILSTIFNGFKSRYNEDVSDYLIGTFVIALYRRKLFQEVINEYEQLAAADRKANEIVLNCLISIGCKQDNLDLVLMCLNEIPPTKTTSYTFNPIFRALKGGYLLVDAKAISDLRSAIERAGAPNLPEGAGLLVLLDQIAANGQTKQQPLN